MKTNHAREQPQLSYKKNCLKPLNIFLGGGEGHFSFKCEKCPPKKLPTGKILRSGYFEGSERSLLNKLCQYS